MSTAFPSAAWARALVAELSASDAYASAAAGWSPGEVALAVSDGPQAVLLELGAEGIAGGEALPGDDARARAALVLEANGETWSALLAGERDPIKALMCGDVKVRKGGLASVVGQVLAYQELILAAARAGGG